MCAIFKAQFIQVFLTVLSQKTVVSRVFAWLLATDSSSAKQAFFTSMKMEVWRRLKCLTNQGLFCHFYCNVSVSLNRSCRSHFVCRPTSRDNLLSFINRVSLQSRLGTSPRRYRTSSFVSSFFYLTKGFFFLPSATCISQLGRTVQGGKWRRWLYHSITSRDLRSLALLGVSRSFTEIRHLARPSGPNRYSICWGSWDCTDRPTSKTSVGCKI